jgi:hypothetical protein
MIAIVEAILAAVAVLGVIKAIFTPSGRGYLKDFFDNIVRAPLDVALLLLREVTPVARDVAREFAAAIGSEGPGAMDDLREPMKALSRAALETNLGAIATHGEVTPDNWTDVAGTAFSEAFGFGLASAGVAAIFESVFPEKLNTLNGIAPILAKMAGFDEIAKAALGPYFEVAIGRSAKYAANKQFKPEFPDEGDAVTWHSRGLISEAQLREIFQVSGLKPQYEEAFVRSAYRALQPRMLMRGFESGIFADDELHDLLTFAGIRPIDQERMVRLARALALEPYKKSALTALNTAFERGAITEQEFTQRLGEMGLPDGAEGWVQIEVRTRKVQQLLELYRKSISDGYAFGQVLDSDYVNLLEAGGMNAADANAHYAIDSIRKRGKEALAERRAEEREAALQRKLAIESAQGAFEAGDLEVAGLTASLLLAGVPAASVALLVSIAETRRQGRQRHILGKILSPADAQLLVEKVAAVKKQTTQKLLDADGAKAQLKAFGLDDPVIEALVSLWVAQAYKQLLPP